MRLYRNSKETEIQKSEWLALVASTDSDFESIPETSIAVIEDNGWVIASPEDISGRRLMLLKQSHPHVATEEKMTQTLCHLAKKEKCTVIQYNAAPDDTPSVPRGFYCTNLYFELLANNIASPKSKLRTQRVPLTLTDCPFLAKREYETRWLYPGTSEASNDVFKEVLEDYKYLASPAMQEHVFLIKPLDSDPHAAGLILCDPQKTSAIVCFIYVSPDYRGKHIGSQILKDIFSHQSTLEKVRYIVSGQNLRAINQVLRAGFQLKHRIFQRDVQ